MRSELRPDSRPLAGEEGMWMVLQWPMIRVEASMVIVVVGDGGVDAGGGCGGGEEGEEDEEVGHVLGRGGWGGGGGLGGFVGRGGVGGGHYAVWRFLWVEGTGRKIMYGC